MEIGSGMVVTAWSFAYIWILLEPHLIEWKVLSLTYSDWFSALDKQTQSNEAIYEDQWLSSKKLTVKPESLLKHILQRSLIKFYI